MILAICGLPGSGKTTLAHTLARRVGAEVVAWDDHETMTGRSPDEIECWLRRGAPFDEITAPGLVERLRDGGERVILDGLLGPAWPPVAPMISASIWLDCPPDIALARKMAQMLKIADKRWIAQYLEAYPRFAAPALVLQQERVPPLCSVSLDASSTLRPSLNFIEKRFFSSD